MSSILDNEVEAVISLIIYRGITSSLDVSSGITCVSRLNDDIFTSLELDDNIRTQSELNNDIKQVFICGDNVSMDMNYCMSQN